MPATVRLTSRIPEIIATLQGQVEDGLRPVAEAIAEDARDRVPVLTGALQAAIHVEDAEDGVSVVAGNSQAWYGHIVENGSARGAAPHPFLRPAFEAHKNEIPEWVRVSLHNL